MPTEVLEGKLWREQLREWDEEKKPAAIAKHREIQAVDPASLNDDELVEYLRRLPRPPLGDDHAAHDLHRRRGDPDRRLRRARRRMDGHLRPPSSSGCCAARPTCRRAAPTSSRRSRASRPIRRRWRCWSPTAIPPRSSSSCARCPARRAPPSRDGSTSWATGRSTASTSPSRGAIELPEALLKAIRVTIGGRDTGGERHEDLVAGVRERVPEEHRAFFDELLGEARLMYRLRDERGVYSDIWASGLMRPRRVGGGPARSPRAGC